MISNRRIVVLCVVCLLIGSLATLIVVEAQAPALSTVTITGGPQPGAPSYTIFAEGGIYYAKDANGAVSWSSTNATYIMEQAKATTGKIYFSAGTFPMHNINITTQLTICGQGNATKLSLDANTNLFSVTASNVKFYDLVLYGNSYNGTGIYLDNVNFCQIENVWITYFGTGQNASGRGVWLHDSGNNWIVNSKITSCSFNAIFNDASPDTFILGNDLGATGRDVISLTATAHDMIQNNLIYMGGYDYITGTYYPYSAIDIYGCKYEQISNNRLSFSGGHGAKFVGSNFTVFNGNYIFNNNQWGLPGFGVFIQDSQYNNLVGNTLYNEAPMPPPFTANQYGLNETGVSNYNTITNLNALNQTTYGIGTLGANTTVSNSWNGTTWINVWNGTALRP